MSAVIILGGHRTGTSIVTQIVHRLGFAAATQKSRLVQPRPTRIADNPDGYWEDRAFVQIHRRMLSESGRRNGWIAPRRDEAVIAGLLPRYQALVRERERRDQRWCLKDPRLCLLADALLETLDRCGVAFRVVTTERPIIATTASLRQRGLAADHAFSLATRYEAARWSVLADLDRRGTACHPVEFDQLTNAATTARIVREIAEFLAVSFDPAIVAAVRPEWNHHRRAG